MDVTVVAGYFLVIVWPYSDPESIWTPKSHLKCTFDNKNIWLKHNFGDKMKTKSIVTKWLLS